MSLQEKFRNRAGPVPNITRRMGRKLKKNDKNIYFLYFFMMNEDGDITWEKHKKRKYLVCVFLDLWEIQGGVTRLSLSLLLKYFSPLSCQLCEKSIPSENIRSMTERQKMFGVHSMVYSTDGVLHDEFKSCPEPQMSSLTSGVKVTAQLKT